MRPTGPTAGGSEPRTSVPGAVNWFWQHQGGVLLLWTGLLGVTVVVPSITHWWEAGLWSEAAISIVLGACYLAAAACGIRPRRSGFAGLATIVFGVVWSLAPLGGWGFAVLALPVLAVMGVAVILAAKALDEDRRLES